MSLADIIAWAAAGIIALIELPRLKELLTYLLLKLYKIFIQHDIEGI